MTAKKDEVGLQRRSEQAAPARRHPVANDSTTRRVVSAMKSAYLYVMPRPKFEDAERERLAAALWDIVNISFLVMFGFWLQAVIFETQSRPEFTNYILAYCGWLMFLNRVIRYRGLDLAAALYATGLVALYVATAVSAGTPRTITLMLAPFGVTVAVFALGLKRAWPLIALFALALVGVTAVTLNMPNGPMLKPWTQAWTGAVIVCALAAVFELLRTHLVGSVTDALQQRDEAVLVVEKLAGELAASLERTKGELSMANRAALDMAVLNDRLQPLATMVSGVAHELGTPVGNAALGASNIMDWIAEIENPDTSAQRRSLLLRRVLESGGIIQRNMQKVHGLISNFKRVSADHATGDHKRVHVASQIQDSLLLLEPTLAANGARIILDIDENLYMDTYPASIDQLFTNLITNAIQHGFDGRTGGTVVVKAQVSPGSKTWIRLSVKDDGIGMTDDVVRRIFDPFFTTKRGRGGTGLGLSIVHTLVTAKLHGTIAAQSDGIGQGARFVIDMPLVTPLTDDERSLDTSPAPLEAQSSEWAGGDTDKLGS